MASLGLLDEKVAPIWKPSAAPKGQPDPLKKAYKECLEFLIWPSFFQPRLLQSFPPQAELKPHLPDSFRIDKEDLRGSLWRRGRQKEHWQPMCLQPYQSHRESVHDFSLVWSEDQLFSNPHCVIFFPLLTSYHSQCSDQNRGTIRSIDSSFTVTLLTLIHEDNWGPPHPEDNQDSCHLHQSTSSSPKFPRFEKEAGTFKGSV